MFKHTFRSIREHFQNDFTTATLKTLIVLWALFVIVLVLFFVDNKWLLAGILAYEVLP